MVVPEAISCSLAASDLFSLVSKHEWSGVKRHLRHNAEVGGQGGKEFGLIA